MSCSGRILAMMRYGVVACLVWLAMAGWAQGPAGAFSDELDAEMYDCAVTLSPAKSLAATATAALLLDWRDAKNFTRVAVTRKTITVETYQEGRGTRVGQVASGVEPGKPYRLTVMRRGASLGLLRGTAFLFRGDVPRAAGVQAGVKVDAGWAVLDSRVQRLEPVHFADNFMRTADESGGWARQSGEWLLASAWDDDPHGHAQRFSHANFAQNPFAWLGRAATGFALCTAGRPNWEDYTMTVAVCPPPSGAVGVAVNVQDARHGLVVRWSAIGDRTARGNQLGLYALADGALTPITSVAGGFVPGQWCRLTVISSLGAVRVLVDGRERLAAQHVTPWRGGVGLYAEGKGGAVYDDVTVYGRLLNTDLLNEEEQLRVAQRFKNSPGEMQEWAATRTDWRAVGNGDYSNRQEFFGEHRLSLTVTPLAGGGRLWLSLGTNGTSSLTGYRGVIEAPGNGKNTYTIYRDNTSLATASGKAFTPGEKFTVRFWREQERLRLEVDGETVAQAAIDQPVTGLRPAYHAEGCFVNVSDPIVLGRNVLDYTFAEAPADWLSDGTWEPSVRWACSPQWSFLGGWSRGDAALWHKQRFTGDQTFEAFLAPKMEYPRETHVYLEQHYRDMCITICGDGRNPRTGYTAVCGAPDADGNPTRRAVLWRNGTEVAARENVFTGWPYTNAGHRAWYDVELRKRGNVVEVWVENVPVLSYTDPNPIAGGVPAIWTTNNGMMVARARLLFANSPAPRTETRVVIDTPEYPEWFNVGETTTLAFPNAWSTSGKPAQLKVNALLAPTGEASPVAVKNTLTFTPKVIGDHWYRINAVEGEITSPSFHLFGPSFNPALGRDDSHAVVLYRFTEGKGEVVKDLSTVQPAADLRLPQNSTARWLPRQGLSYHGGPALRTAGAVGKLAALAKSRAATIELWLSTESMYPPPYTLWLGNILSWEAGAGVYNFALGHQSYTLFLSPAGGQLSKYNGTNFIIGPVFRTSLHHWVITWNGTVTRCYLDGRQQAEQAFNWNESRWNTGAPLLLGNTTADDHGYLGTFYLVAIHDKCLTADAVKRHYQAGPAGK